VTVVTLDRDLGSVAICYSAQTEPVLLVASFTRPARRRPPVGEGLPGGCQIHVRDGRFPVWALLAALMAEDHTLNQRPDQANDWCFNHFGQS